MSVCVLVHMAPSIEMMCAALKIYGLLLLLALGYTLIQFLLADL